MRSTVLFHDHWKFSRTRENIAAAGEAITLPHTWNAVDGQDGGNDYYRGTCWYLKEFTCEAPAAGQEIWLEFDGVAMIAQVYLNDVLLTSHAGGYSTFRVNLTKHLKEGTNTLLVSVDNADNSCVYPQKADFTFYGGIYREVKLLTVPSQHFALEDGNCGLKVTPVVDESLQKAVITLEAAVSNAEGEDVVFTVCGADGEVVFAAKAKVTDGKAICTQTIEGVHLWDGIKDPYLYTASAALSSGDCVSARFGCRRYAITADGFFLNGRAYPLRGVSRHQDRKGAGNVLTKEMHREDMELIREIGANTIRLAHYQHAQEFYDLCDEYGMITWAEIPYITMHMSDGRDNTLSQMRELVTQNYNHPSIAVWGLSNEITAASAVNEELLENHRALNDLCHSLDATRPTTMANVFMLETDSPILEVPDVNSYNLYFGWYLGELEQNDEFFDDYHAKFPDRAIGFSEYGADANPAFQSSHPEKGDYTESYQCVYHEHMLKMIEARPWLWATHVWNMFDFAADGRDEGGKHGENQKGLVTFDRQTKKDPFYLYKAYWNQDDAFVHICGSRYVDRAEEKTQIKVYSNQKKVTLYVDGREIATKEGEHVFLFEAELPEQKEYTIEAKSGDLSSIVLIRRVAEPNPAYTMANRGAVVNWFDNQEINQDFFSVMDKLSELREDPKAGAIIDAMMAKGASERGDVADAVKDNPALQRMMGRMTLVSLLKQGGAKKEDVEQLNRVLQTIPKATLTK